jgi:hypothetical protein
MVTLPEIRDGHQLPGDIATAGCSVTGKRGLRC